jgi:hypothetical protein
MAVVHPARAHAPHHRRHIVAVLIAALAGVVIGASVADVGAAVVRSLLLVALVAIVALGRPHQLR